MRAVRAIYERGDIRLLEPAPPVDKVRVIVVFPDGRPEDTAPASGGDAFTALVWGEPIDEDGAGQLIAVHEELQPLTGEAEEAYLAREDD